MNPNKKNYFCFDINQQHSSVLLSLFWWSNKDTLILIICLLTSSVSFDNFRNLNSTSLKEWENNIFQKESCQKLSSSHFCTFYIMAYDSLPGLWFILINLFTGSFILLSIFFSFPFFCYHSWYLHSSLKQFIFFRPYSIFLIPFLLFYFVLFLFCYIKWFFI
jgi:hypothetical protein